MAMLLGNAPAQLRVSGTAVVPVSLTFAGDALVRCQLALPKSFSLQLAGAIAIATAEVSLPFVLSMASVIEVKAMQARPVVQITY